MSLPRYLEHMLEMRKTKDIDEVSEEMREFWVWYGLDCIPKASNALWPWSNKNNRMKKLFNTCVSASDEALALQVLDVRGVKYLGLRSRSEAGAVQEKAKKGKAPGEKTMSETTDVYVKYHKLVEEARPVSKGWYEFLRWKQNEMDSMRRSGGRKRKVSLLNSIELPFDTKIMDEADKSG